MTTTSPVLGIILPEPEESADIEQITDAITALDSAIGLKGTKTTITTLANSTTETALYSFNIGANVPVVGSVYRIVAWGQASTTGTPTITFRMRLGGVGGTLMAACPAITTASGIANKGWRAEADLILVSTPGSGAGWQGALVVANELNTVAPNNCVCSASSTAAPGILKGSDVINSMVLTAQWSAASVSNTLSISAGYSYRATNFG